MFLEIGNELLGARPSSRLVEEIGPTQAQQWVRDTFKAPAPGDAGYDLPLWSASIIASTGLEIPAVRSGENAWAIEQAHKYAFRTGLSLQLPRGCYGRVAPRSGLAYHNGLDVLAGVIDTSYEGEIIVVATRLCDPRTALDFGPSYSRGQRIAQLIVTPYVTPRILYEDAGFQSRFNRGDKGFGSSGE